MNGYDPSDDDWHRFRIMKVNGETEEVILYAMDVYASYEDSLKENNPPVMVHLEKLERVAYFLSNEDVLKNIRHGNTCVNCNSIIATEDITYCAGHFPIGLGPKFHCEKFVICRDCVTALPRNESKNWLCPRCADGSLLTHEDIWGSEVIFPTVIDGTVEIGTDVRIGLRDFYDPRDFRQPADVRRTNGDDLEQRIKHALARYQRHGGADALFACASYLAVARRSMLSESLHGTLHQLLICLDDIYKRNPRRYGENPLPRDIRTLLGKGEAVLGSPEDIPTIVVRINTSPLGQVQKSVTISIVDVEYVIQEMLDDAFANGVVPYMENDSAEYRDGSGNKLTGPDPWNNGTQWKYMRESVSTGIPVLGVSIWSDFAEVPGKRGKYAVMMSVRDLNLRHLSS